MSETPFRDRFAIEAFSDGGILINLATGGYCRLNRAATAVCQILASNDDGLSAKEQIVHRFSMSESDAATTIREITSTIEGSGPRRDRPDPFVYSPAPDGGYLLSHLGSPQLWISSDGLSVRLAASASSSIEVLFHQLRSIAPRVLFLQGSAVLHGAACYRTSGASVFCGDSGAGKTTTAYAFDSAGARLLAEDMLVLAATSPLRIHIGGEESIREWARAQAPKLRQGLEIETSDLRSASQGATIAVEEVWFISAAGRVKDTDRLTIRPLGPTDGALAAMASLFLGATSPKEWRRFLRVTAAIATSPATFFEARMPEGLDELRRAVRLYKKNSAW